MVDEFIITDEMDTILSRVKTALGLSVLNYQYGYVEELNQTLNQWENDPVKYELKFPLVWLAEPFNINRAATGDYDQGELNIFIINSSQKDWKAIDRMNNNFKPVIYPIYQELTDQMAMSNVFSEINPASIRHITSNRYYFSDSNNKKATLNDIVDCMKLGPLKIGICPKPDTSVFTNIK